MKKQFLLFFSMFFLVIGIFFIPGCYLGKNIDKPVSVYIDYSSMNAQLNVASVEQRYINYRTIDDYKTEFINGLTNETTYQKNVTIVQQLPADYTLRITYFEVAESEIKETVNDEKSPYNGQSYMLTAVNTKATFDIQQNGKNLDSYTAYADRSEKLKNNQSLGQMIIGANKDNTVYREKLLQDDICMDLSGKCGRRTWNLFTQKLVKKMK
ncbi:MAG: hypothetical protein K0S33_2317 [Bacteroidetes bacterium]|nr:hypothetical protein [Bacteroidota bacterium]